jgi:hypothetical protein
MPCPYFFPMEQFAHWARPPKLPLGDPYTGLCHANPASPVDPGEAVLKNLCSLGYARGMCGRFPPESGSDAVRFCITEDGDGLICLLWVREKDHHPCDHGRLEYALETQAFTAPHPDAIVQQQAQAYVASYVRRRTRTRRTS